MPLQQGLRHLQGAFVAFWAERAENPRFKSRKRGRHSAEYTRAAFRYRDGRLTLAKMSEQLDISRDHLHKLSTRLVRENQTVVVEDLSVRNMLNNHRLARAISDAAWRELRSMVEHKCRWYGRDLVVVDRWYPSSKMCSVCGALHDTMPLNVRAWKCRCGAVHDRDVNAAANMRAAGLAVLACGDGVRPAHAPA